MQRVVDTLRGKHIAATEESVEVERVGKPLDRQLRHQTALLAAHSVGTIARTAVGAIDGQQQLVAALAAEPVDFYFKLEETGKKKNRATELTVCVIPKDLTSNQEALQGNVRKFMETFVQYVAKYESGLSMEEMQKALKSAEGDFAESGVEKYRRLSE